MSTKKKTSKKPTKKEKLAELKSALEKRKREEEEEEKESEDESRPEAKKKKGDMTYNNSIPAMSVRKVSPQDTTAKTADPIEVRASG